MSGESKLSGGLDVARISAASAIWYYHAGLFTAYPFCGHRDFSSVFIALAGLTYSCFSRHRPGDGRSYGQYLRARGRAFFPLFVVCNVLIFLASYIYPSDLDRPFTLTELFLSSAGVSQYFHHRYLSVVMWFTPFILQTYLLLPGLAHLVRRGPTVLLTLAAFACSLGLQAWVFGHWPAAAQEVCRNWSPLFRLPEVWLGLLLGEWLAGRCAPWPALATYVALAALLAMGLAPQGTAEQAYILSLPWSGLLKTAGMAVLALALAQTLRAPSGADWLRRLGVAAFPFFLTHGIGMRFIYTRYGATPAAWAVYFMLCWAVALLLARAVRRLTEVGRVPKRGAEAPPQGR